MESALIFIVSGGIETQMRVKVDGVETPDITINTNELTVNLMIDGTSQTHFSTVYNV